MPEERVNPAGKRTAAAGRGASLGLRAPLPSARARVTSEDSRAAELLGEPAANPSSPGAAAGSSRLCRSDHPHPSAGSREPLGPGCCTATSNPHRADTQTHTSTRARTHTRTNPLGQRSPGSPQQGARLQGGRRSEEAGGQAILVPAARFLQEKPPRRPKNKVNFKVMRIVTQRSPPTLGLKIASHNWKKTKKKKKRGGKTR